LLAASLNIALSKGKAKTIPLQTWTDLEGFRRLRLPYFNKFGA
jgi:hypothetical protein